MVMATLSGKPLKVKKIRPKDQNPGLNAYEANFLRLLEAMTNGSRIEVSIVVIKHFSLSADCSS